MNHYTLNNIGTISDMRLNPHKLLKKAQNEPVYVFHRTKPKAVIMSIEDYLAMQDNLEDYYLAKKAEEYEKEDKAKMKWVSQKEVEKMFLKND